MTLICLLALPLSAYAKGPKGYQYGNKKENHDKNYKQDDRDSHARQSYASHPRSGFVLTFGTGYAGQGYYYGPPASNYYYERSDVRYYASREAAPREYFRNNGYQGHAMYSGVQRELARRGYYHGYIDGQIGPQSRRAIGSYQRDRGLRPTGVIDSSLLHSLGLR
jgi:hypothetical protein